MKRLISYLVRYPILSNLLMIAILAGGLAAVFNLRRERLPSFSLDRIIVAVPYPDALPEEIEEAICIKIEEELKGLEGIKNITSTAYENAGRVTVELLQEADQKLLLSEIRNRVDGIDTFPEDAEKPQVSELFRRDRVISLALFGNASEQTLKELAREIEDELLLLPGITQSSLSGVREYEIAIEVSENALREYSLRFSQVAEAVRNASLNIPGGTLRTTDQQILLQTKERKYTGKEYQEIVLQTYPNGTSVRVKDVATVIDGFAEEDRIAQFNKQPAVILNIFRTDEEDALHIAEMVKEYRERKIDQLPEGISLKVWLDNSTSIYERIDLLLDNGLVGFILVLMSLGFFLNIRLSLWVALGIPISFGGGLMVLWAIGGTINMISLFAMIMALGIVVDDAIVIGENIYALRQQGATGIHAAVQGTIEMAAPVVAAVSTTIVAFMPMLLVTGTMGKFIGEIPKVMIAVLSASLFECLFILPAHLRDDPVSDKGLLNVVQRQFDKVTDWIIHGLYKPVYFLALKYQLVAIAITLAVALFSMGIIASGQVPFIFFPQLDDETIRAQVVFPEGTPPHVTKEAVRQIESAAYRLDEHFSEEPVKILQQVYSIVGEDDGGMRNSTGANLGAVTIEIVSGAKRNVHSRAVIAAWRQLTGKLPGVLSLTFGRASGHVGGNPIEIALSSDNFDNLKAAANDLKKELAKFSAVFDIEDDYRPGKLQIIPRLNPEARLLGIDERILGQQLRQAFAGEEVFRLQRSADEIKVKVRYPRSERESFGNLQEMRIRLANDTEIPFATLASFDIQRGPSQINRLNGHRIIRVLADLNQAETPTEQVLNSLNQEFLPQLAQKYPGLSYSFEGQEEERRRSTDSLNMGFIFALFGIYAILAIVFKSYLQPFIIMSVIPFGFIGAVMGHWAFGYPMVLMSFFGMVALAGIVVNDSLVLVDRINVEIRSGKTVIEAVQKAGLRRFRAIILTTATTIAGLLPIMFEQSLQAQFIIPMALSISGGLFFATFLTLFLVPCLFLYLNAIRRLFYWLFTGKWPTAEEVEPAYKYRLEDEDLVIIG